MSSEKSNPRLSCKEMKATPESPAPQKDGKDAQDPPDCSRGRRMMNEARKWRTWRRERTPQCCVACMFERESRRERERERERERALLHLVPPFDAFFRSASCARIAASASAVDRKANLNLPTSISLPRFSHVAVTASWERERRSFSPPFSTRMRCDSGANASRASASRARVRRAGSIERSENVRMSSRRICPSGQLIPRERVPEISSCARLAPFASALLTTRLRSFVLSACGSSLADDFPRSQLPSCMSASVRRTSSFSFVSAPTLQLVLDVDISDTGRAQAHNTNTREHTGC